MPKWFVTSRGVMGPLLSILAVAMAAHGVEFSAQEQTLLLNQAQAVVLAGMAVVGSVVGIYGRWKARGPVTIRPGGGK